MPNAVMEHGQVFDSKKEQLAKTCDFLDKNRDRMHYNEYLEADTRSPRA